MLPLPAPWVQLPARAHERRNIGGVLITLSLHFVASPLLLLYACIVDALSSSAMQRLVLPLGLLGPDTWQTCIRKANPNQEDTVTLTASTAVSHHSAATITEVKNVISSYHNGLHKVIRATMVTVKTGETHDVVCKVACTREAFKRLQEESRVYDHLRPIMPDYVPYVFALFTGETYEGRTGVLVMQDGGERLYVPLDQQPTDFRCVLALNWLLMIDRNIV